VSDLPFQDSADTAETRRTILGEIERLQARFLACMEGGAARTFDWAGRRFWVDRRRWLALKAQEVEAFIGEDTLPVTAETEDLLDFYGGASRSLSVIDVADVFAWLLSGTLEDNTGMPSVTQLLNLVVVQPLVNPASAPIFWVALNAGLAPDEPAELIDIMRPMIFDMATWPESRSAAAKVRAAQADFFEAHAPAQFPADWAMLDDRAWAEACKQLVAAAKYGIESHVFELVTRRAAQLSRA
jgi:hypothetical protein